MRTTTVFGAVLGSTLATLAMACSSGASGEGGAETSSAALVVCVDAPTQIPSGAWQCGEARTLECTSAAGATPPPLYVRPQSTSLAGVASPTCADVTFASSTPASGPYALGHHDVVITQQSSSSGPVEVCRAELTVRDTTPPVVTTRDQEMWAPNHKMHRVAISDCAQAVDTCDPAVAVFFTAVTSDEPVNAQGDGNSEPDVDALSCGSIDLRAERQGGADGRVYRLFWRAIDASGNAVDGSCRATVPHDQSGRAAVEGAPAYRAELPSTSNCR